MNLYYRLTPFELAEQIKKQENLEFISGKWFKNKKEIKDIRKYLMALGWFKSVNRLDETIDVYILLYGNTGLWYDLQIVEDAKKIKELKPLCYPLNTKQLKIINYLLRHDEEIFFILTGVGGSGKSTFGNIICQIFENDTASLSLSDLGDPFMLATGVNHRLIYSTEINSDEINNGKLKQLFSNEEITVNPKFEKPYKTRCQSAFFFNCNIVPKLDLCDSGILRRILYYSMDEKIKNPNPKLNKITWEYQELVNIVAHALSINMENWQKDFEKETRYNLVKNNSVYLLKDKDNYKDYANSCREKGYRPFSENKYLEIRNLLKEWKMLIPELTEIVDIDEELFCKVKN